MKNRKLGMLLLLALFVAMALFATGCGGDAVFLIEVADLEIGAHLVGAALLANGLLLGAHLHLIDGAALLDKTQRKQDDFGGHGEAQKTPAISE